MISIPIHNNIKELWSMSVNDFNKWRSENDLPELFNFFCDILPGFKSWLMYNHFEIDYVVNVIPSGALFTGIEDKYIIEYIEDKTNCKIYKVSDFAEDVIDKKYKSNNHKIEKLVKFKPYFIWAREKLKNKRYIKYNIDNNQMSDTFVYTGTSYANIPLLSRTRLLNQIEVLKLGGVFVKLGTNFQDRNLDFVDLDYLAIKNLEIPIQGNKISFSSCNNMLIDNTVTYNFSFYSCKMRDLVISNTEINNFKFIKCNLRKPVFVKCELKKTNFEKCDIHNIGFDKCDLTDVKYKPSKLSTHVQEFENLRAIRLAYQNIGDRANAKYYYFKERVYERKSFFNPFHNYSNQFDTISYPGKVNGLIKNFFIGRVNLKTTVKLLCKNLSARFKLLSKPKLLFYYLKFKFNYFKSLIESLIWGYGEKPSRTIYNAALIILLFSCVYYFSDQVNLSESVADSLYFSVVTFTTLGYGDIKPSNDIKLFCSLEALLGALFIGLFIAGFSNQSKY